MVATYAKETKHLFMTIMEAILESLGIVEANQQEMTKEKDNNDNNNNNNIMNELDDGSQMLVTNFYPPCPEPDLTLGMHPHSDYGFLTLLLQDEVEGLQIQFQDKWLTVQPIPNAFVVNIGDHLEVICSSINQIFSACNCTKYSFCNLSCPNICCDVFIFRYLATENTRVCYIGFW